jgi:hypothetical protein
MVSQRGRIMARGQRLGNPHFVDVSADGVDEAARAGDDLTAQVNGGMRVTSAGNPAGGKKGMAGGYTQPRAD